jgi:hypothetical protein
MDDQTRPSTLEELHSQHNYEEITKRFENFLGRYREIFNPRSPTRKVLGLAMQSVDIYRTIKYLTHSASSHELHSMRMSLIESFGEEELNQVVYLAFLETINKFDPHRGVPLEKFIYNYFPYVLSAEVNAIASPKQVLNSAPITKPDGEVEWSTEPFDVIFANDELFLNKELDDYWINGECDEPFTCLTPLERKLLVMIFIEKATHEEIGAVTSYHFSSIKRKKNEIIHKLRARLEELAEEEE